MTLGELRKLLATEPPENENLEVKIWLPGSRITLAHMGTMIRSGDGGRGDVLMIEGNLDAGSALEQS